MANQAQIGVTGLAVMGRNLARNLARNGFSVALHNRTPVRTRSLVEEHGDEGTFVPSLPTPLTPSLPGSPFSPMTRTRI